MDPIENDVFTKLWDLFHVKTEAKSVSAMEQSEIINILKFILRVYDQAWTFPTVESLNVETRRCLSCLNRIDLGYLASKPEDLQDNKKRLRLLGALISKTESRHNGRKNVTAIALRLRQQESKCNPQLKGTTQAKVQIAKKPAVAASIQVQSLQAKSFEPILPTREIPRTPVGVSKLVSSKPSPLPSNKTDLGKQLDFHKTPGKNENKPQANSSVANRGAAKKPNTFKTPNNNEKDFNKGINPGNFGITKKDDPRKVAGRNQNEERKLDVKTPAAETKPPVQKKETVFKPILPTREIPRTPMVPLFPVHHDETYTVENEDENSVLMEQPTNTSTPVTTCSKKPNDGTFTMAESPKTAIAKPADPETSKALDGTFTLAKDSQSALESTFTKPANPVMTEAKKAPIAAKLGADRREPTERGGDENEKTTNQKFRGRGIKLKTTVTVNLDPKPTDPVSTETEQEPITAKPDADRREPIEKSGEETEKMTNQKPKGRGTKQKTTNTVTREQPIAKTTVPEVSSRLTKEVTSRTTKNDDSTVKQDPIARETSSGTKQKKLNPRGRKPKIKEELKSTISEEVFENFDSNSAAIIPSESPKSTAPCTTVEKSENEQISDGKYKQEEKIVKEEGKSTVSKRGRQKLENDEASAEIVVPKKRGRRPAAKDCGEESTAKDDTCGKPVEETKTVQKRGRKPKAAISSVAANDEICERARNPEEDTPADVKENRETKTRGRKLKAATKKAASLSSPAERTPPTNEEQESLMKTLSVQNKDGMKNILGKGKSKRNAKKAEASDLASDLVEKLLRENEEEEKKTKNAKARGHKQNSDAEAEAARSTPVSVVDKNAIILSLGTSTPTSPKRRRKQTKKVTSKNPESAGDDGSSPVCLTGKQKTVEEHAASSVQENKPATRKRKAVVEVPLENSLRSREEAGKFVLAVEVASPESPRKKTRSCRKKAS